MASRWTSLQIHTRAIIKTHVFTYDRLETLIVRIKSIPVSSVCAISSFRASPVKIENNPFSSFSKQRPSHFLEVLLTVILYAVYVSIEIDLKLLPYFG